MNSILPRYFLRLFLPPFLACALLLLGVLLMNKFLLLLNMALLKGVSPVWVLRCFAGLLPYYCGIILPAAFLVAMTLTLSRLGAGGEILALRCCGFSFLDIMRPFLAVAGLLSLLLLYINHNAGPAGLRSFHEDYALVVRKFARIDIEPQTVTFLGPWRLYARAVDKAAGRLRGVRFMSAGQDRRTQIYAPEGAWRQEEQGVMLELRDGQMMLPESDPTRLTSGHFHRYRIRIPLGRSLPLLRESSLRETASAGLRRRLQEPLLDEERRGQCAVELATRGAAALAPFVLFWLMAPVFLLPGPSVRNLCFPASLASLLFFYGLLFLGVGFARRQEHFASAAPWLADATGLAAGLALTRAASRR
jgi:lipopolysaccharide export LptBFGC system permease protein LptF